MQNYTSAGISLKKRHAEGVKFIRSTVEGNPLSINQLITLNASHNVNTKGLVDCLHQHIIGTIGINGSRRYRRNLKYRTRSIKNLFYLL